MIFRFGLVFASFIIIRTWSGIQNTRQRHPRNPHDDEADSDVVVPINAILKPEFWDEADLGEIES
jgi:hypothetical protein